MRLCGLTVIYWIKLKTTDTTNLTRYNILRQRNICYSRELILTLFLSEKVFSFLSQDEVERMKQEEGKLVVCLL
jgi:hypothetical protein